MYCPKNDFYLHLLLLNLNLFILLEANYFTIVYWLCHTSTWIHHRCTCVPNPETSSYLPPHTIPLGHPSAPAPSILYPALNLDWQFGSYTILYMFQCHSPKSSHLLPLPQSPKVCSIHLCLFCCLTNVDSQMNNLWLHYRSYCFGSLYNSDEHEHFLV